MSSTDGEQSQESQESQESHNNIIQTEEESGIYVDINGVYYFISHNNPARYMNLGPKSYSDFLRHFGLDSLKPSERIRTEASFIKLYGKGFVGFEDMDYSVDDVKRVLLHIKIRIRQLENTAKLMKNITIVQESQVNELRKLRDAAAVLEQRILIGKKLNSVSDLKGEMEDEMEEKKEAPTLQNIQKEINKMSDAERVRTILRIGWLFLHPDVAGSTIRNYWQQLLDETKASTVKDLLAQIDNEMAMDKKFLAKGFVSGKLNKKSTFEKAHEWSLTEEEDALRDISRDRIKSLLHILRVNESKNSNIISDISGVSSMLNIDISASNTSAIDRQFKRAMLPLNAFYEKRYGKAYATLKNMVEKYLIGTEDKGRISTVQLFNESLDLLSIFEKQGELKDPIFLKVTDVPRKLYSFLETLQKSIDASGVELPVNKVDPTNPMKLYNNIIFYLNNNVYTEIGSPLTLTSIMKQSKIELQQHIQRSSEKRYNFYMIISGTNIEEKHNIPLFIGNNTFSFFKNNNTTRIPIVTPIQNDTNNYPKLDKHIRFTPENATPFDYKLIAFIALILFQNL
jgi:hypothetical protein